MQILHGGHRLGCPAWGSSASSFFFWLAQIVSHLDLRPSAVSACYLRLRTGQPLDYRTVVRRHFKPLLAKSALPNIRLYDLRHTCATLLLSPGEHPKIVGERLGHSSTTLTLDTYSHVLPDMQEQAAVRIEETLFS